MTQYAVIKRLPSATKAEVEVMRGTACGDDCGACEVCNYSSTILVLVDNFVGAMVGDKVEIETETKRIMKAALLVYILPIILLIGGYGAAYYMGLSEGLCVLSSMLAFGISLLIVIFVGRWQSKKPFEYNITKIISEEKEEMVW